MHADLALDRAGCMCEDRELSMIIEHQGAAHERRDTTMPSVLSRNPARVSGGPVLLPIGRPSSPVPRLNQRSPGMSARADIYARPDVDDMEYEGASNHDAHFFTRLLGRVRARHVLELACGSGRVAFTLAAALPVAEIVGVDSSIAMLRQAAMARDAAEPSVRERVSLVEGDMRDWSGTGVPFDAVVIACCSVSQLLTLDDRRRAWATAFRLLRPGGVFILDVRVPDLAMLAEAQRVRSRAFVDLNIDAKRRTPGEEARLLRCTATTYEPHLQRADVRLLYDRFDQGALASASSPTSRATSISRPSSSCCFCRRASRSRSSTAIIGSCASTARRLMS
jgi:ubiquinone/menaquinone biosynthesis C-methylase UbiE